MLPLLCPPLFLLSFALDSQSPRLRKAPSLDCLDRPWLSRRVAATEVYSPLYGVPWFLEQIAYQVTDSCYLQPCRGLLLTAKQCLGAPVPEATSLNGRLPHTKTNAQTTPQEKTAAASRGRELLVGWRQEAAVELLGKGGPGREGGGCASPAGREGRDPCTALLCTASSFKEQTPSSRKPGRERQEVRGIKPRATTRRAELEPELYDGRSHGVGARQVLLSGGHRQFPLPPPSELRRRISLEGHPSVRAFSLGAQSFATRGSSASLSESVIILGIPSVELTTER